MNRPLVFATAAAAIGTAALGHFYLERLEAEATGGPPVSILVASEDVPVGATLTEKRLGVRDLPRAYVESRHVRAGDAKQILGTRVGGGLKAGEAVLWSDLEKFQGQTRVLSGLIQPGSRAVVVDSRSADFDGLLRPGDRVDVLLTVGGRDDVSSTVTLVQNLMVLSVGGSTIRSEPESEAAAKVARGSVTLSATVEQAQVLTQAQQRGRLTLTVRSTGDITLVEGLPQTSSNDLVPTATAVAPIADAPKKGAIEHVR
jgi:pilus assembly protein CpaB